MNSYLSGDDLVLVDGVGLHDLGDPSVKELCVGIVCVQRPSLLCEWQLPLDSEETALGIEENKLEASDQFLPIADVNPREEDGLEANKTFTLSLTQVFYVVPGVLG